MNLLRKRITPVLIFQIVAFLSLTALAPVPASLAGTKPKYGTEATILSRSHEYFKNHEAPDFWALSPYYTGQQDDKSCSIASLAMVINAARVGKALSADDELATQAGILKRTKDDDWQKAVGPVGHGVTLDDFGKLIEEGLRLYGLEKFRLETVHADASKAAREKLHKALVENEKTANDFIIINFLQGTYTGDADVGHWAPIGAYDGGTKRALVMDPDRQWYEPYWVSEDVLLKGMTGKDASSDKTRGYIWIHLAR